jgi:MFS family permease
VAAQVFYGWRLLGAFWLIAVFNLAFPAYGSAVLNAAMAAELGFDRQALGTIVAVYLAMSGLPGPLVAASVNRIGVRWTLVIGSVVLVAGSVMLATIVDTVLLAIVAFGVLVGIGVATGAIIAAQAGVARWFVRRRALAFSLLYSAGAIGGLIAPPILSRIATAGTGQWRLGWWLIAALSVVAALIAIATVRERPADLGQAPDGASDSAEGRAASRRRTHPSIRHPHGLDLSRGATRSLFLDHDHAIRRRKRGLRLVSWPWHRHLRDLGHSMQVGAWAVGTMTISG